MVGESAPIWDQSLERDAIDLKIARKPSDEGRGLMAKYRKAWLHSPVLPIQHRVLVYADSPGEIDLPPAPLAAVLPEPISEGLGGIAGNCPGEFYTGGYLRVV